MKRMSVEAAATITMFLTILAWVVAYYSGLLP